MQTILLLIITILLWLDFYIKYEKLIMKFFKKNTIWEFHIDKKWVWDKIKEELIKENKHFTIKK